MRKEIIDKLREMRLPVMALEYEKISQETDYAKMNIEDVLERITEAEYLSRKNNTIERNIKKAKFASQNARLEEIDYDPSRQINKALIDQLSTNDYIMQHRDVIIIGATGSGKSYMGCALGINACQMGFRVMYFRMTELFTMFHIARVEGTIDKLIKKIEKIDLLILDDFLLYGTTETEQRDIMEVFHVRDDKKSIMVCSQCSPDEWHSKLGGGYTADAILDRLINGTYRVTLKGDSLRKRRNKIDE